MEFCCNVNYRMISQSELTGDIFIILKEENRHLNYIFNALVCDYYPCDLFTCLQLLGVGDFCPNQTHYSNQ